MKDSDLERYRREVGWWLLPNNLKKDPDPRPPEDLRESVLPVDSNTTKPPDGKPIK